MNKKVAVGLIQMKHSADPRENLAKAIKNIRATAKRGAQIICLSELFLSEYFCQSKDKKFFALAESIPGTTTKILSALAFELGVVLVASLYEKTSQNKYFNTSVVFDADGSIAGKYRKMHIPDDPTNHYGEAYYFSGGDLGFKAVATKYGKIGPLICYDQWFPESARAVAAKGAEILFYSTAIGWPTKDRAELNQAEHDAWQVIQRSHAIANNVYVVAVNRTGQEGNLKFWGTSFVADPYGRVIKKASANTETNLVVECDFAVKAEKDRDWPFLSQRLTKI
ncbi:MAG: acyltransferase [Candidatus Magasanikbacteria bacterium RIFOXYC2_FULL_42_28]|uniref:Acyltransferase n=1 Tax=Candidatus Magasanikbacteria bacterium RIFOXYC2_FULL_42_28 TaxID=1798704 RepID=A0A1F6NVM4_9BACT|nr:MAG: acyltransferase [Candidatus Magasanikbacteria bacterium RIFOXYC2_FULL_42_28]